METFCKFAMLASLALATGVQAADQSWLSGTTIYDSTYTPAGLAADNDLVDTSAILIVTNGGSLLANQLVVGQTPSNGGTLTLATGGSITVQKLLATNNTAAASGSFVNLNTSGTLITSNLNGIAANIVLPVPNYTNTSRWTVSGTWNMNGGTNFVTYLYSNGVPRFAVGANSTVSVNANAVLNLTNSTGTNMDLIAGYGTAGGKLVVNGGVVTGYRQLQIGATTGTGNSVIVTNGGTLFGGSGGGAGTLGIGAGTGTSNSLAILGSASRLINNGLTLNVGNTLGSSNNNLMIDAGIVTNVGAFNVGVSGNCQGNVTIITNGGQLFSTGAVIIGGNTNANNNSVNVFGAGSLWNAGGASVSLATAGNLTGNNLTINGGMVTNINNLSIGSTTATNNNANSVLIANGGQLYFTNTIFSGQDGTSNSVTVTGPGSLLAWNGSGAVGNFYTGRSNGGNANSNAVANSLVLSNGAQIVCSTLGIGRLDTAGAACSNNYAIIGGGGANALLNASFVTIGFSAGATNNYLVLNAGGIITNATTINIGVANSGGSLLKINGGSIIGKTSGTTTLITAADGQLLVQSGGVILDDNGSAISVSVPLQGDPASSGGGLTKLGSGTVTLAGTSTFTGGTTISAGTLKLGNGSINGSVVGNITNNSALTIAPVSDQTLANTISGTGSLTKTGASTATLAGVNTYTGNTIIGAGSLALSGSGELSSPLINIGNGAYFDVSGLTTPFQLQSSQTLANSASSRGYISGNVICSNGTISISFGSNTNLPALTVTNGTFTLSPSTTILVDNPGSQLPVGSYKIISFATGGSAVVAGAVTTSPVTVGGSGAAATATLAITGGELFLNVVAGPSGPTLTSVTPSALTGSSYPVNLILAGSGFTGATAVLLTNLTAATGASYLPTTINGDTNIVVSFLPGTATTAWNATVVNGTPSAPVGFTVTAPTAVSINTANLKSAGAGNVVLSGTGGTPGHSYAVVNATNLNPPILWSPVVTNVFDGGGNFSYTNTVSLGTSKLFLRLQQ